MKIYTFNLNYSTAQRGIIVDVTRAAVLRTGCNDSKLSDIAVFLEDLQKIKKDVKRLAKNGEYITIELCVSEYNDGGDQINFDRWYYSDEADENGIHLEADEKYTEVTHDMWIDFENYNPLKDITA